MMSRFDATRWFERVDGYCYPDWDGIRKAIEEGVPVDNRANAWNDAAIGWLEALRDLLRDGSRIHQGENFLLLANLTDEEAAPILSFCEAARKSALAYLGESAHEEKDSRHVVLAFAEPDRYFEYILPFHVEGDIPMSGGMFIEETGFPHIAIPITQEDSYFRSIPHELAHALLAHRDLPPWVNEAAAQRVDQLICGAQRHLLDAELAARHREYWTTDTIQRFWSGQSWHTPGDEFSLSYSLAEVLWYKMEAHLEASHEELIEFLKTAERRDAGARAFEAVFATSLGDLVADFLGEGDWVPAPMRLGGTPEAE